MVLRLLASLVLLIGTVLGADSHRHVMRVNWLVASQTLDWSTTDYSEEEKRVGTRTESFLIDFRDATMTVGQEVREFEERERAQMSEAFAELMSILARELGKGVVAVEWRPETLEIELKAMSDGGLQSYILDDLGRITEDEQLVNTLKGDVRSKVFSASDALMQYCVQSIQWWEAGKGRVLTPAQRKA